MTGKILNLGSRGSPQESRNLQKTRPKQESFHLGKPSQDISPPALTSPCSPSPFTLTLSHSPSPPTLLSSSSSAMPFEVSNELQTWLTQHGLAGYLQVYDADAHPRAQAIASKIHPGTITNDIIRSALHLPRGREYNVEAPPPTYSRKIFWGVLPCS